MSLSDFSVKRPIFTTMVTLIVVVLGSVSLARLKIDLFPSIELPTVSIRTSYPGASPEVIETLVTQIIEEIISTVPGVEEVTSESSEGNSRVRVRFSWGTDINAAALELQATLEDEINELPDGIERPRVSKFDVDSFPVVILGVSGDIDPVELTDIINNEIRFRFSRVPGVAQVDLWGGYNREIRVEIDRQRLQALGIPLNQILQALRDSNLDRPSGSIQEGRYEISLRAPAQFQNLDQIRNTVVDTRDGTTVTLEQVALVKDTHEKETRIVRVNGVQGIRVAIRKQDNANTVEVSQAILEEIERTNKDFPLINIVPVSNSGNFIERSIQNVSRSVLYGGGLAILVLLFFLRDWRSTLVISLAIPISIISTFALLYFGGFTLNMMSLGGLALGVGMMVDSSIVVLENIFRRRDEEGEVPKVAAASGAREVATAIIASTITTLVIFLPLIFVPGVSGILFRELAYTVSFSLVCSLVVSLSLVPMLSAKLLRAQISQEEKKKSPFRRLSETSERWFQSLESNYKRMLNKALRHRRWVLVGAGSTLVLSFFLAPMISSEFMPPSDEGEVGAWMRAENSTRLEIVDTLAKRIEEIAIPAVPEAISHVTNVRGDGADISFNLVPASQRSRSNAEIAEELRTLLDGKIPGVRAGAWAPRGQNLLNRLLGGGGQGIEVEVRGPDIPTLEKLALDAKARIEQIEGVTDVDTSFDEGTPRQEITIDRDKVADLGLSARDVSEVLQTAIAGSTAGNYQTSGNSYRILVQMANAEHLSIDEVLDLTLRTPSGELVALRNLVTSDFGRAPSEIERRDQQRLVTLDAEFEKRALGDVSTEIEAALNQIPRPSGYAFRITGAWEEQQKTFNELGIALGLAIMLVYMVLACQYESLRDPTIVMVAVPMAAIGVILTLILTGTTMNLQSGIGCIMLGGIVVNNAILLVDQASQLRLEGAGARDAVAEAGRRRLRPILMTTLTTVLGLLPLALGIGEGADAQAPLARAVIGGLVGSTAITLLLTPVVYSIVHSKRSSSDAQ
ncbi:efflux RND transporter permease subunit [Pelagicoccus sp. SDUM812005]|uniref:efflux RND transporter permease subunit n=1 Tax=Pelagicoccus sp. SDUM812005 TaxID=3041257 RepID=UPI00281060F9|nr:efflux RND transporter permease subunit [Pelagicoccus sp. SDUM812005]MDQ8181171.1 efflux RND transporter permease subunit [Pelagicoccus sp. SDUM812005]